MKSIYDILKDVLGVEVPEDKKASFESEWKENYRTKSEYDNAVKKRDEYKKSLEDVQAKLEGYKDVDVEELKGQISTLTKDLQTEKDERAKEAAKMEAERSVDAFLGDKKFVNEITQKSIRSSLIEELDKDSSKGKSIEDLFKALTSDAEGKPLQNVLETDDSASGSRARFTSAIKNPSGNGGKYSMSELMKMANDGVDVSQYYDK